MSDKIKQLETEISELKQLFNERLSQLEAKLNAVKADRDSQTGTADTNTPRAAAAAAMTAPKRVQDTGSPANKSAPNPLHPPSSHPQDHQWVRPKQAFTTGAQKPQTNGKPQAAHAKTESRQQDDPWVSTPQVSINFSFKRLFQILEPMLGPASAMIRGAFDTYQHYKEQGKAPVFLLTAAGIIALVLGFGYLLQYSFSNWFNEIAKVAVGFVAANAIIALGIRIQRKKPGFEEYAAALIGLGVILNYLCVYFIGPYYRIVSPGTGFVLLIANTCAAYFLASVFETRIVAVITLLGGATTPLLLNDSFSSPLLYLYYICFLTAAILHLANKIRWKRLTQASWLVAVGMVELTIHQTTNVSPYALSGVPVLLFYMFFYFTLFNGKTLRQSLVLEDIILISANIAFYIYTLYTIDTALPVLGAIYFISALSFIAIYWIFRMAEKKILAILILTAGILLGFAILAVSNIYVMGLFWSVEALCLVYFGFRFDFKEVRAEGYLVLLVGFAQIVNVVGDWLMSSRFLNIDYAWGNLVSLGVILFGTYKLLDKHSNRLVRYENIINRLCKEAFSFWISLVFFITCFVLIPQYLYIVAVAPMFLLLFRYAKHDLPVTQYLALAHVSLLVTGILLGAFHTGNFHFMQQPLIAKIARIEFFAVMWLLYEFYLRFKPQSNFVRYAKYLRLAFYMGIPVIFLPHVARNYPQIVPIALWLSTAIAYGLHKTLKYEILRKEFLVFALATSVTTVIACFMVYEGLWQVRASEALAVGNVLLFALLYFEKGLTRAHFRQSPYKFAFTLFYYYLGASIYIASFVVTDVYELSLLVCASYFYFLALKTPVYAPLRNNLAVCLFTALALSIAVIFAYTTETRHFNLLATVFMLFALFTIGYATHCNRYTVKRVRKKFGGENFYLWGFHILVAVSYCTLAMKVFRDSMTPAISVFFVIHATIVLFLTLKPRYLALIKFMLGLYTLALVKIFFIDMSESSLIEKVVALLVIGVLLLGGAFQFQKLRSSMVSKTVGT